MTLPVISTYLAVVPVRGHGPTDGLDERGRWKTPRPPDHGRLSLRLTGVPSSHSAWSPFRVIASFYAASLLFGIGMLLLRLEKTRRIVRKRMPTTEAFRGTIKLQTSKQGVEVFASQGRGQSSNRELAETHDPSSHNI